MKKVLFIALLLISGMCYSQDRKTTFGIQVGYSSSWSSEKSSSVTPTDKQLSGLSSIAVGGLVNYKISDIFSLQGEVFYAKRGFVRDITYSTATEAYKQTQEYSISRIEIPVLARLSFTKSKMLYFMTGVSPSFVISSKYLSDVAITKPSASNESIELDEIPTLNTFDMPIVFSLGFERPISKTFLGLQIRYNQSLMDYFDVVDSKVSSFNLIGSLRF